MLSLGLLCVCVSVWDGLISWQLPSCCCCGGGGRCRRRRCCLNICVSTTNKRCCQNNLSLAYFISAFVRSSHTNFLLHLHLHLPLRLCHSILGTKRRSASSLWSTSKGSATTTQTLRSIPWTRASAPPHRLSKVGAIWICTAKNHMPMPMEMPMPMPMAMALEVGIRRRKIQKCSGHQQRRHHRLAKVFCTKSCSSSSSRMHRVRQKREYVVVKENWMEYVCICVRFFFFFFLPTGLFSFHGAL